MSISYSNFLKFLVSNQLIFFQACPPSSPDHSTECVISEENVTDTDSPNSGLSQIRLPEVLPFTRVQCTPENVSHEALTFSQSFSKRRLEFEIETKENVTRESVIIFISYFFYKVLS